jgi:ATP-dependent RNA helicase DeaD
MKHLTKKYLKEPKEISAGKRNISASNVAHELYVVSSKNTYEAMRRILDFNPDMYGIVFCRTRRETQSIAEQLVNDGYRAEAIHGDLSQAQRDDVMKRFRNKSLNVMVATDVAARGIDVNDLTHVINVNIPDDPEVYVHRSGRTGRAGASGISLVITHGRNMRKVKNLERIIGKTFETKMVPSGEDICQVKMRQAIGDLEQMNHVYELDPTLVEEAMDKLAHLSKADLIERFLGHEVSTILSRYRGARNINETAKKAKEHGRKDSRTGSEEGFKTIVVDLGYRQNVNPSRLMGVINDAMEGTKVRIGKIDMDKTFTRIDVEERHATEIAARLSGAKTGSYIINAYFEEGGAQPQRSSGRSNYGGGRRDDRGGKDRGGRGRRDGGNSFENRGRREDRGGFERRERRDDRGGFERRARRDETGGFERRERNDFNDRPRREAGGSNRFGRDFGDRLESREDRPRRKRIGEDNFDGGKRKSSKPKFKGSSKFKGAPRRNK